MNLRTCVFPKLPSVPRHALGWAAAAAATACCLTAMPARAGELPADAHIVFDLLYGDGQMRVGRAEEHWHVEAGHYELITDITPMLGPHIRYVSKGRLTATGLVPDSYGEYRNTETEPRNRADFDWDSMTLRYGKPDDTKTAPLLHGAQDVNAFSFQLSWLGDKAAGTVMQVTTGKKVATYSFAAGPRSPVSVNGQTVGTQAWRSGDGSGRTEIWVSKQLDNLPVRVIRIDDEREIQLVARSVEFGAPGAAKDTAP